MPEAFLWLGPPWLNLRFSLAVTICESCALFFVCSILSVRPSVSHAAIMGFVSGSYLVQGRPNAI